MLTVTYHQTSDSITPWKVAIVDDDRSIASIFSTIVKSMGHNPEFVAGNGKEIVDAIASGVINPDLIIMDYRMPIMNGLMAAELIRNTNPKARMLIASADDSIKQSVISRGCSSCKNPLP